MSTTKTLAFVLALAAGGCAASVDGNPPDDPNHPGDPNPDPDPLPPDVDASGKYAIKSSIDLAQNAPGKAGDIAREFIKATDDADDPTSYLLDLVIDNMSSGTFKSLLQGAKPFVAGYLNDRLLDIAPDFVTTMLTIGNDFGDATKSFGLNETLDVTKSGGAWMGTRTVVGARFKIDNVESDYAFADYNTENVVVPNVGMTVDPTGKLSFADHKVALAYGKVLRIALDGAIIPSLDPAAANLGDLLQHQVNCQIVGEQLDQACYDAFGFSPGVGTFRSACTAGLSKAADVIYGKIADLDSSALELQVTGTAKALDKDANNQLDTIQTGTWAGTMSYAGTPATLTGATFFGSRM